jgi:hypothetical protein
MRFLFSVILGAVLISGAAYYRDSVYASATAEPPVRPIVNWDVAGDVTTNIVRTVRAEFDRLLGR